MQETKIINYKAPPTVARYIKDNSVENYICGPIGSGKSVGSIMKCMYIAKNIMRDPVDGIRKSRIIVSRKTEDQLNRTFAQDFIKWFPPDGKHIIYRKKAREIEIKIPNEIECMIYLIPLDTPQDKERLLSTNVTAICFDECIEADNRLISDARGRTGRYPGTRYKDDDPEKGIIYGPYDDNGFSLGQLFGSTNPPEGGTWWQDRIDNPPPGVTVFRQPSGLSEDAENLNHLPPNFYQEKAISNDEDWVRRYVHGLTGRSKKGKPVYSGFIHDYHVSTENLEPTRYAPVIVGMDFGLNPSAVFLQQTLDGKVHVLDELTSDGMGIKRFMDEIFTPLIKRKYLGVDIQIFGDPSGAKRTDTNEKTNFDYIKYAGYSAIPAHSNVVADRVESVNGLFCRQIQGEPAIMIDHRLSFLIAGLDGKYHYKTNEENGYIIDAKPVKNEYSHIQDALQYACMYYNKPMRVLNNKAEAIEIKKTNYYWDD